ncbi:uncharacterized protein TRIADDRAFT_52260 [Trichoplax adhaerens]|uniref:EamA domain-containing protein n=1 Tax=Trichoplax adhaerens TaxID=10228 RepID=B3RM74_TRIAD|nr:hypothetical protein TRIADDRAFT_52260 [Trichoplax adhaerens]EDV28914.1 hypothetical protein TRIADDRAFT_52260 [Trichoplax adhaerens]|eukprot:XP_002108116.1 hypothetical protein TRIADDRAFT_52260 [Trichoplax adhaerens]
MKKASNGSINSYQLAIAANFGQKAVLEDEDHQPGNKKQAQSRKQIIIGVAFVIAIAVCTAGATQFGKDLYEEGNFTSTSLVAWSSRSMAVFIYPAVSIFYTFRGQSHRETYKQASKIFGQHRHGVMSAFLRLIPITALSTGATYLSFYALRYTSSTDVTAVFSASAAIVYVLSLLVLNEPFVVLRFLAVLMSVAGVVVIAYSEGFGSFGAIGVILVSGSAAFAAVYRVLTKKVIGEASLARASLYLSVTCFQALILFWIPIPILYFTGVEEITFSTFPWTAFFLCIFTLFLYSILMILGINFTYPIYMSMGPLLGIPINAAIDVLVRNQTFSTTKIIGTMLLILGFLILTIPLSNILAISSKTKLLLCKKKNLK